MERKKVANTSGTTPPSPYGDWAESRMDCASIISVAMWRCSWTAYALESITRLKRRRPSNQRNQYKLPST
eukprot:15307952-Alexandrium_andersonii.AAC.1